MTFAARGRMRPIAALIGITLLAAACSAGAAPPSNGPASTGAPDETTTAWRTAALRDVRTGEEFTIDSLLGKLVTIEPMAIWCSTCRIQQGEVVTALAAIDSPDVVYISLDIDPNERSEDLAAYADSQGFDWRFVVASPEVARSLSAAFGAQSLSPPSTPHILVGPDGTVIESGFGIVPAPELESLLRRHLPSAT